MIAQSSNANDILPVAAPLARRFRRDDDAQSEARGNHHEAFLTVSIVRRIKQAFAGGMSRRDIANAERLSYWTVSSIVGGRRWADVQADDGPLPFHHIRTAELPYLTAMARTGDQEAFTELIIRHEHVIYSKCWRMLGDEDAAADVCQDVMVKVATKLAATAPNTNFGAWVFRIAHNACLDILRRRQRIRWQPWEGPKHDPLLMTEPADDPEGVVVGHENRAIVRRVLARMTARHRLALVLREYRGMSCAEIGGTIGLSRSAVKSLLFRARAEFRAIYGAIEAERGAA